MVTDEQVRRLFMLVTKEPTKELAAAKAGMAPKTAYKYRQVLKLPSELKQSHDWRTRTDPFADKWPWITELLVTNPGLEAKTIFDYLRRVQPDQYEDGQLRTLQRRIKQWRAIEGPAKEVFFSQIHYPGDLGASDFTHMNELEVTIEGDRFDHMVYHFCLTYSNWEDVTICYSESFENLSEGLQNAFWNLGMLPKRHRTDCMSLAVNQDGNPEKFTRRYSALMRHYGVHPEKTNPCSGHENGDVEQRHNRFKQAVAQELMLRGSRDFASRKDYARFLREIIRRLNAGRQERLEEELAVMHALPKSRMDTCQELTVSVGPGSTITVLRNIYSVHSRLIGEHVDVRAYVDHLEVWYAQRIVERIPRLRGQDGHRINYRHIVDWLARKPGAFANYRYQADMFPSSYFKIAYDQLRDQSPAQADKEYIQILRIAAYSGEEVTQSALRWLLSRQEVLSATIVEQYVKARDPSDTFTDVHVNEVRLQEYDELLTIGSEADHE